MTFPEMSQGVVMIPFEDWLTEERRVSDIEAAESHKAAMNSYGAGYDAGYVAALRLVAEKATSEICGCLIEE